MSALTVKLAEARKLVVAAAGAIVQLVPLLALHGAAQHYASIAVAIATTVGVYLTPNAPPDHPSP